MKLLIFLKRFLIRSKSKNHNRGFTFLEFIFVVSLLSLTSSLVIPMFKNGINKSAKFTIIRSKKIIKLNIKPVDIRELGKN